MDESRANTISQFDFSEEFAHDQDSLDHLRSFRQQFHIPSMNGMDSAYFCGNSLGLQPKEAADEVNKIMSDWAELAVKGHSQAEIPWMQITEPLKRDLAFLMGAKPGEIAVGNTLTVNLHLLLVSFYRPTPKRHKILMENKCFPSDRYAVKSHLNWHGYDEKEAIVEVSSAGESYLLNTADFIREIEVHKEELALILIGGLNYYNGQLYDLSEIARQAKKYGIAIGLDLAHVAGNVPVDLRSLDIDFACWCTYKYLNGGPGSLAALYVNERHLENSDLHRFEGWWGNRLSTRFEMNPEIDPWIQAERWIVSNPPILGLAPLFASMRLFKEAEFQMLRKKSKNLTAYLEFLLRSIQPSAFRILTPSNPAERGCQMSLHINTDQKDIFKLLKRDGIIVDWRNPGVIRVAPVPLYNSYHDVFRFYNVLKRILRTI